jgi:hypothetical protein
LQLVLCDVYALSGESDNLSEKGAASEMTEEEQHTRTLTNDQIRVSENVRSATDILRSAKPFLDEAVEAMQKSPATDYQPVEVPANVLRDLVVMLAAEIKRADALARRPNGDPGDGDWNPFNGIDFEFD